MNAIRSAGRRRQQPAQGNLPTYIPAPLVYVFFKYARRWLNHHHALIAVDTDQIILADQNARQRRAKHSRNAQATRDDCGMRCASAAISDETAKGLRCTGSELEHVSR